MVETKQINTNLTSFFDQEVDTFGSSFQNKFLKVFIEDDKGFVDQIVDIVCPDYFDSYQKIILDYQLKYYNKYKFPADYDELRRIITTKDKGMNQEHLMGVVDKLEGMDLDKMKFQPIKDDCYEQFKSRSVQNVLMELAKDWKINDYGVMKGKLENAIRVGEPKEIGHRYLRDVRKRLVKDFRKPIPALPGLDELMSGGLSVGELGIVLAPTGGGKSMALVRFAIEAIKAGYKVVYYTLELSENVVGQRFDASFGKIAQDDVWYFPDYIEERLNEVCPPEADFVIKWFPTKGADINGIAAHLHHLKTAENFEPDLVLLDYADLLKPVTGYTDKRHELTAIFESLRNLAGEFEIPVWTATQTNREAMNKEVVTLNTIGESIGKAQIADVVIGIARPDTKKGIGRATISILKSRLGRDGIDKQAIFNTDIVQIEILSDDEYVHVPGATKAYTGKKGKSSPAYDSSDSEQEILRRNKEKNKQ